VLPHAPELRSITVGHLRVLFGRSELRLAAVAEICRPRAAAAFWPPAPLHSGDLLPPGSAQALAPAAASLVRAHVAQLRWLDWNGEGRWEGSQRMGDELGNSLK
jgi:hypothetical protein